ncbi:MAG: hypothetical protein ACE5EJ_03295 [Nitrosopumilaceae archaeon]
MPTSNGRTRSTTKKALGETVARERAKDDLDPKSKQVSRARKSKVKKDTAEASAEKAAAKLAAVNVEISKSLANIQNQTQGAIGELNTIREAIAIAEEEYSDLHGKDVVASSIAELIESYENKKAELEAEFANRKTELQSEIDTQEKTWEEAQNAKERERRQLDDDYSYNLGLNRRREDDVRKEQFRRDEIENQLKQEELVRGWEAREKALNEREEEFNALKAEVDGFTDKLKKEADTKVAIATNALKKDLEHKNQLREMEFTTRIAQLNSQVETLNTQNTEKDERIESLQGKLVAAEQKAQELAIKALEVQSGQEALRQVQSVVEKTSSKK